MRPTRGSVKVYIPKKPSMNYDAAPAPIMKAFEAHSRSYIDFKM